jgi:ATP-dependent RNA circularization protein (DNA/RNA ligase family)
MSVDHAIPTGTGRALGISIDWFEDYSNLVLCCSGCNGYENRYVLPSDVVRPKTETEFFDLRDRVFEERMSLIASRRTVERRFYERRFWECEGL